MSVFCLDSLPVPVSHPPHFPTPFTCQLAIPIKGMEPNWEAAKNCQEVVSKHFKRVFSYHGEINIDYIQVLIGRVLENPSLIPVVRRATESSAYWIFRKRTALGEVLGELQNSQDSPYRKLLSKKTLRTANQEAARLVGTKTHSSKAACKEIRVAAWSDDGRVYGRVFHRDKTEKTARFPLASTDGQLDSFPQVICTKDQRLLFLWKRVDDLYMRVFTQMGTPIDKEVKINVNPLYSESIPSMTHLSTGKIILKWDEISHKRTRFISMTQSIDPNGFWGVVQKKEELRR